MLHSLLCVCLADCWTVFCRPQSSLNSTVQKGAPLISIPGVALLPAGGAGLTVALTVQTWTYAPWVHKALTGVANKRRGFGCSLPHAWHGATGRQRMHTTACGHYNQPGLSVFFVAASGSRRKGRRRWGLSAPQRRDITFGQYWGEQRSHGTMNKGRRVSPTSWRVEDVYNGVRASRYVRKHTVILQPLESLFEPAPRPPSKCIFHGPRPPGTVRAFCRLLCLHASITCARTHVSVPLGLHSPHTALTLSEQSVYCSNAGHKTTHSLCTHSCQHGSQANKIAAQMNSS